MSGFSSPRPQRAKIGPQNWRIWHELKIKVVDLPFNTTTLDIYKVFECEGEISRIELQKTSRTHARAFVSFRQGIHQRLQIELLGPPRQHTLPSPANPSQIYDEVINLSAQKLQIGFMYSASEMMVMRETNAGGPRGNGIRISVNLQRREISIRFTIPMVNEGRTELVPQQLFFRLSLAQMDEIFEETAAVHGYGNQRATRRIWTIPLPLPPLCFRKVDVDTTHKPEVAVWNEKQCWYRQTDVTNARKELKNVPIALRKMDPAIDIGRWTVYRLEISHFGDNGDKYNTMRRALIDWNIKFNETQVITTIPRAPCQFWDMLSASRSNSPKSMANQSHPAEGPISLPFAVRYQLEVCLSNGIFSEYNITHEFMEHLASMGTNRAISTLEKAAENSSNHFYDPMDIFDLPLSRKPADRTIPKYCAYSRSLTITPTSLYLSTPTVEISNRVIRDYAQWQDHFLRVKFSDEKYEGKIHGTEGDNDNEIYSRVWRTLRNGINIAGRSYKFLAFGNSQFREHGAYFFAPLMGCGEDSMEPSIIRQEMGDFRGIHEVARFAARMGQCFSTTRAVHGIEVEVKGEEDVVRNGYTFTDGVGRLSISVAKHIAEDFGLPFAAEDPPSLFQFRLGGCKGVLAIDPRLEDGQVRVRRSQRKFDSSNDGLEIIRWSQFAPATLNRQLIIVLESIGVEGDTFIKRQDEQVSDLTKAMSDELVAQDLLHKNIDFNMMTLTIAEMIASGFMAANDPFTMSVLRLWRSWNTKYLKEKAKIFIKDGAFLLGCVDETATLKGHFEDRLDVPEVFVQVSDPDKQGDYKVIEGVCIVARNPSLHPGDIRVVHAVDVPALHHLKNVLVFPQTGDRDLPNMCSGGDLDGDDYIVIWDKSLIPAYVCEPMDFSPPDKMFVDEVHLEDVARFFVEYIKNDSLGRIATHHLALADWEHLGVKSPRCVDLAKLHSTAVDYPKSGVPARMQKDQRATKFPHFMPNRNRPADKIYHSKKILGQLFDQVQKVDFEPVYDAKFDSRILDAYQHSEETLITVADIKQVYDTAVHRIMAQHGIGTEFEVWSVFILDHNNQSRDYQMTEEFGRISGALKERFQNICIEQAGGRDFKTLAPFVAAMYVVTATQIERAKSEADQRVDRVEMPLMSFPWIFAHILGKIATGEQFVPDFTVQSAAAQRTKKPKNPVFTTNDLTAEDEMLMRGDRKHHEVMDLFGDVPSASQHPYIDTLKDVSTMPTEPVSYEDFVKSDAAKTKQDLLSTENPNVEDNKPRDPKKTSSLSEKDTIDERKSHTERPLSPSTKVKETGSISTSKEGMAGSNQHIGGILPIRPKDAAHSPQIGVTGTRDLQYVCEVLSSPQNSSSRAVSPMDQDHAAADRPKQYIRDVLIPGGPNTKPKSLMGSAGASSFPTGLPMNTRLNSASVNFQAGPPGVPAVGIDPKSINPPKDNRRRWPETARSASSPGTIHQVLSGEIDVSSPSTPVTLVGDGEFDPVEPAAAASRQPFDDLSQLMSQAKRQTKSTPQLQAERPLESASAPANVSGSQGGRMSMEKKENMTSSVASQSRTSSVASSSTPKTAFGSHGGVKPISQKKDVTPSVHTQKVDRMSASPGQSRAPSAASAAFDRSEYIKRLMAAKTKTSTPTSNTSTRESSPASATGGTAVSSEQPASKVKESQPQSQSQAEDAVKGTTTPEEKKDKMVDDDEEDDEEVTLEVKPNSTRSLLSRFG
ncbi:RNA dependent RNA polymerase-domain-containing protein [Phyllosticta capitalensis]